jgi:DNA-binding transcriptional regulator LsrR (DeoR family)
MAAADRLNTASVPAPQLVELGLEVPVDPEEQLATRAAWLYFVAENTQAQIGKKLGLSRVRVNRLLAYARRMGLVQITISGRLASSIRLEDELKQHFGLRDAVVVPSAAEGEKLRSVIAAAAGRYLSQQLKDGMSVGVGWGQTLRHSLSYVPHKTYKRLSVVSLIGGLTHSSAVNPHETASHLADIIGGQCYYFAGPAFTDTEATREILMNQPMMRDVFERGRTVDLAFLSVGELGYNSTMVKLGLITADEVATLKNAGAEGDLCSHWLDARGQFVEHALNRRAVALPPEHLRGVPRVILVSGGKNKVVMMHGVLSAKLANIIITDETTARALLLHKPGQ